MKATLLCLILIAVCWLVLIFGLAHEHAPEPAAPVVALVQPSYNDNPPRLAPPSTTTTTVAPTPVARTAPSKRGDVWLALASCESGQRWTLTGRHHEGGLQFAHSTWDNYRRVDEPADANLASPAKQIEVAKRVLRAEGVRAWPTCGPRVGLTMADAA